MSAKKTVLDTIQTALETISGVGKVVQYSEGLGEADPVDMPALYMRDAIVERDRIAFPASTLSTYIDMEALLTLEVQGKLFEITNQTATPKDEYLGLVEKKLVSSTAVAGVVKDIYPVSDVDDEGVQDNFATFTQTFEVWYHYNHANP